MTINKTDKQTIDMHFINCSNGTIETIQVGYDDYIQSVHLKSPYIRLLPDNVAVSGIETINNALYRKWTKKH